MRMMVLGFSLAVLACWPQTRIDDPEDRMLGRLGRAGVDIHDEAALIGVLERKDAMLAAPAAYALGKLPTTSWILRALNSAALADDELLMNYAIRALLKHGDREWVPAAAARLRSVRDDRERLNLAGELACAGTYDGWDLIETAIVAGELWQRETALIHVGNFRGMKDASGKPVDLLAKLDELRLRAPESARSAIFQAIVGIGVEDMAKEKEKAKKKD